MKIKEKILQDKKKYLDELYEILQIPSVAVEGNGVYEVVEKIKDMFLEIGVETNTFEVNGSYPYLFAEFGEGSFTLLIYDHYDVQPTGDLNLWKSNPFQPEIREGKIYARGVADNKGNLMLRLQAIRLLKDRYKKIPIKIKWIIEGEEELGSPNLEAFSQKYGHLWNDSDLCLWESGGVDESGRPVILFGYKGISYMELSCKLGEKDLHSGNASYFDSAVWKLVQALNTLRDKDGYLTIPKLTECIEKPTEQEMQLLIQEKFDAEKFLNAKGRTDFIGNHTDKIEILKRHYFYNTCNISGLWAGYTGQGIKSVMPCEAHAKLDIRLVKNQNSKEVAGIVSEHLKEHGFDDITVRELINEPVSTTDIDNPIINFLIQQIEISFEKEVNVKLSAAGTGPAYFLSTQYKIPIFSLGALYPGVNAHAPNEHVREDDYFTALSATYDILLSLSEYKSKDKR
ncbi:M20/M25/M40 family metallo-hydrolase [Anaeromicropila populeti]|uniref:Acetylornithine deacetylase/Succinyl-diaminopimelate desuccinylase n=1 Tax=Anaeromicropila populeti TaxID=37658 RepID=A0A1I6L0N6_9FIRM|nr:M20/M25/M40 family metallo-hydrolase [Anaeromicropila populeti]SFR97025.1 Acetylornithine deacetylase/Succinyl-diaminopimelate desuccinylase [Anaeromicropila populeti]